MRILRWWLVVVAVLVVAVLLGGESPEAVGAQSAASTPALPFYFFEDDDPYLTYGGNWSTVADMQASGGTVHEARTAGAYVTFRFHGPYVKWYATQGPNGGRARVVIDGEPRGDIIDLYRPTVLRQQLVSWIGGLESEQVHTLHLEVLGERNGSATDSLVFIDAFEVRSAPGIPVTRTPRAAPFQSPTPTPEPTATPTPPIRGPGSWPIDVRFLRYYVEHDGPRILGNTISPSTLFAGNFAQYFEKGRIEDHSGEGGQAAWRVQYGLIVDELHQARVPLPVGGEHSTVTYATINDLAALERRVPPPAGFAGGVHFNDDGSVFVPFTADLSPAPGHVISPVFWTYMEREDLFPTGWLHDIGLPLTEAIPATVDKGVLKNRQILIQAFQRTVLTYDALNPAEFQVERANVGSDYRQAFPDRVPQ